MKPKTIISCALFAFVAASVTYLVVKEAGGRSVPNVPAQAESPGVSQ